MASAPVVRLRLHKAPKPIPFTSHERETILADVAAGKGHEFGRDPLLDRVITCAEAGYLWTSGAAGDETPEFLHLYAHYCRAMRLYHQGLLKQIVGGLTGRAPQ